MPAKHLEASAVPRLLEAERLRFSDVADDLLEPQKDQLNACLKLWLTPDTSSRQWGRGRARQFLEAVYNDRSLGKDVFLLCALAVVVTRLGRINLIETVSELRKWWRKVDHPRGLTKTAEEYVKKHQDAFSKIKRDSNSPSLVVADDKSRPDGSQSTQAAANSLHGQSTDQEEQYEGHHAYSTNQDTYSDISRDTDLSDSHNVQEVFEHASLQGAGSTFDKYLCDVIRKVRIQVGMSTVWKASVTTVFPLWGPVDCLLSLDICEWGVEYLMMSLFNAKIRSTERGRHIVLREGMTMILPNSETIFKGVNENAIIRVFGPEIHKGVVEGLVRKREVEEGKEMTECVSMILTKQGAIINLSLSLEHGLDIKSKLYS